MYPSKLVRRLIVVAVVLSGLAVAADVVALQLATSRAATGIAQATAAERARVDLGGFPFLPKLFRGRFDRVDVRATGLSGGGLLVASIEVHAVDVAFPAGGAVALIRSPYASRARVTAGHTVGRAVIAEQDLLSFLRGRVDTLHDLRIGPQGVQVRLDLDTGELSGPIRILPRVEAGRLVLRIVGEAGIPKTELGRVRDAIESPIELPPIPQGVTVEPTLGDGSIALEASAPRLQLVVGEGGIREAAAGDRRFATARAR